MPTTHRPMLITCAVALLGIACLYAVPGNPKPQIDLIDVISEGGMTLVTGLWLVMVLSSRPAGRVTRMLSLGLAGIMLGAWADCMDEFFTTGKGQLWHHLLEGSLSLGGMLTLTLGLYYWRREQFTLNAHLQKRERVFRNHRGFDPITQLQDAHYLRQQICHEQANPAAQPAMLAMFDIDQFHRINRDHGQAEGDRVLQALSHVMLLNMRSQDLLCRYAGDRFALLLPSLDAAGARDACEQLCRAVRNWRHHTGQSGQGGHGDQGDVQCAIHLSLRYAICPAQGDAAGLLATLSRQLERSATAAPFDTPVQNTPPQNTPAPNSSVSNTRLPNTLVSA